MERNGDDKKRILQRLNRIEGQIRGIHKMIEEDKYCVDVLVQVAAARAALDKAGLAIFEGHTRGCIVQAIKDQRGDEAIEELMDVLARFLK